MWQPDCIGMYRRPIANQHQWAGAAIKFVEIEHAVRREQRIRMVLPLRVSARDTSDAQFEELATLSILLRMVPRLGAISPPVKDWHDDCKFCGGLK
jgi:hypothetical protein